MADTWPIGYEIHQLLLICIADEFDICIYIFTYVTYLLSDSAGDKRPGDQQEIANKRMKNSSGYNDESSEREHEREDGDAGHPASSLGGNRNSTTEFRGGPAGRDRPSFNHYSSKPQLYNASLPFHMHGMNMYPPPPPPPPPNSCRQHHHSNKSSELMSLQIVLRDEDLVYEQICEIFVVMKGTFINCDYTFIYLLFKCAFLL
ncbi:Uncharacterized protein GBIM_06869 [Gryllus bimaculatus]|nr:Uncharacterized protein GBIM_06869 [Gryllus bimaculatus]